MRGQQFAMSLLTSRYLWWGASIAAAGTLTIGQIVGKVSNQQAAIALGGAAPFLAAGYWLGRKLDDRLTVVCASNFLSTQWEIDRHVDDLNLGRLQFEAMYQQMMGTQQQGALPGGLPSIEAMQTQMAQAMGGASFPVLPAGMNTATAAPTDPGADYFPVEDIADLMARCATNKQTAGSVVIACPKGTGKSNLLRAAIAKLNAITNGNVDFSVFNGKEDRDDDGRLISTFCGLEQSKDDYLNSGDEDNIQQVSDRLEVITRTMEKRNGGCPMVQVLDEWNNTLVAGQIYDKYLRFKGDKDSEADPELKPLLTLGIIKRCTKGRSKLVSDWITSHSPLVKNLDVDTTLQQSFTWIVLGRLSNLDAIHGALRGNGCVKNEKIRKVLLERFEAWESARHNTPDRVVALTNMGGEWRLVYLPKYPDHQPDIARGAANQSTDELLADHPGSITVLPRDDHGATPKTSEEPRRNPDESTELDRKSLENLLAIEFQPLPESFDLASRNSFDQNSPESGHFDVVAEVFRLKALGWNQKQIIHAVWGVSPGESKPYEQARAAYQAIASEIREPKGE